MLSISFHEKLHFNAEKIRAERPEISGAEAHTIAGVLADLDAWDLPDDEPEADQPEGEPADLPERVVTGLSTRVPFKQAMQQFRNAKHPLVRAAYEHFEAKRIRQAAATEARKVARRRARREEERQAPRRKIEEQAKAKLEKLYRSTRFHRRDKQVAQIVGREVEIVAFWSAMQLAQQEAKPVTDRVLAALFLALPGAPKACTKDAARRRREVVNDLQQRGLL